MNILIVSPTYNERKNIVRFVESVFSTNPDCHLLIVDDNSPDGTADQVKELQNRFSNLYLECRPGKAGLGTAYCFGFTWALERDYDAIVQMDTDLSHDPREIPVMLDLLTDYDLVIGSRYCDGISVVRWPLRRLMLSFGANLYSRVITGMSIKDSTGGFKVWKKEVLESIDLKKIRSNGYSFQIEMNFLAWIKGFKLTEIPIVFTDRTVGESKMHRGIVFEAIWMVPKLLIKKIFRIH